MPILAICTKTKRTFKLGTRLCRCCHQPLTHFKARVKTAAGWSTRQSSDLGQLQAFLADLASRPPRPSQAPIGGNQARPQRKSPHLPFHIESQGLNRGPLFRQVWASFLPWAMEHLRSWQSYETLWRIHLSPTLGDLTLPEVTPERLYDVMGSMSGLAPATRYQARALASRLFTWARRRMGYRGENPVQYVEPERFDNTRRRVLSHEETERLLAVLNSWPNRRAALLILFLFHTGRRRGEVRALTWTRVDLERGVVTFDAATTKSKRTNMVPVSIEAWDILREAHSLRMNSNGDSNESALVFPALTGKYAWHLEGTWACIRKAAGIEDVVLHDLRRGWISRTLARGVGAFLVKDLVGHEHITTTQRYVNLDLGALERAVRP